MEMMNITVFKFEFCTGGGMRDGMKIRIERKRLIDAVIWSFTGSFKA